MTTRIITFLTSTAIIFILLTLNSCHKRQRQRELYAIGESEKWSAYQGSTAEDSLEIYNDTIRAQIKVAEKLREYIDNNQVEEAIALFSMEQRSNIRKFQEEGHLEYWKMAWTFDDDKMERYKKRIIEGKADFIFEENEWRIDEK